MPQSFKQRLAALERLEAQHEAIAHPGDLTAEDCATLLFQVAIRNVRIEGGRAVRSWRCGDDAVTAAVDVALLRLNLLLANHLEPPPDSAHLAYGLMRQVPDAALPDYIWGAVYANFFPEESTNEEL
jgi:hypothetical protein